MFNTGTNNYILELTLELNLTDAAAWLSSAKVNPSPTARSKWQASTIQQYKISVIPTAKGRNVYFHQQANVFSHSVEGSDILCGNVNAAIDLEDFFTRFNVEELEWELWQGSLLVSLNKSPIFIAPLEEAAYMQQYGKTRCNSDIAETTLLEVAFPSKGSEPVLRHAKISQSMAQSWVLYSNQLFSLSFEIANRRVEY